MAKTKQRGQSAGERGGGNKDDSSPKKRPRSNKNTSHPLDNHPGTIEDGFIRAGDFFADNLDSYLRRQEEQMDFGHIGNKWDRLFLLFKPSEHFNCIYLFFIKLAVKFDNINIIDLAKQIE